MIHVISRYSFLPLDLDQMKCKLITGILLMRNNGFSDSHKVFNVTSQFVFPSKGTLYLYIPKSSFSIS